MINDDIYAQVRQAATQKLLFLPHTIRQMSRPDRMISTQEVEKIIMTGEVIEDYPQDSRGHSCLILGLGQNNRPIHIVCSPKNEYLAIITAYLPDPLQWSSDFNHETVVWNVYLVWGKCVGKKLLLGLIAKATRFLGIRFPLGFVLSAVGSYLRCEK